MTREARIWLAAAMLTLLGCAQACSSGLEPPKGASDRVRFWLAGLVGACELSAPDSLPPELVDICEILRPKPSIGPVPTGSGEGQGARSVGGPASGDPG